MAVMPPSTVSNEHHMRIYFIDSGTVNFHGSKKAAMKAALQAAREIDTIVTVELLNVSGTRSAMIDLANGIVGEGEVVATVGPSYDVGQSRPLRSIRSHKVPAQSASTLDLRSMRRHVDHRGLIIVVAVAVVHQSSDHDGAFGTRAYIGGRAAPASV